MSRRIAIVEDEPAIRANYAEALRRHGYEVATYASRAEALAAFRTRLARPRAGRHRPARRHRRRLRADPRIARAVGDAADHLPVGARQRFRRRRRIAPWRRRLPDQGREPAASCRAHRRAVPPQRAARGAAGVRRHDRARAARARRQAPHRRLERQARRPHADRVLDGACARALSRPRQGPRCADARRQHRRRRQHDHVARQAHPPQVPGGRRAHFDRIATVYGMGYRWNACVKGEQPRTAARFAAPRRDPAARGTACAAAAHRAVIRAQLLLVLPCSSRCRGSASNTCASWSACCATRRSARWQARRRQWPPRCTTGRACSRSRPTRSRRSRASAPTRRRRTGARCRRRRRRRSRRSSQGLSRTTARIWVIDRDGTVLARAGTLKKRARRTTRRRVARGSRMSRRDGRPALRAGAGAAERGLQRRRGDRSGAPRGRDVEGALAGILTTERRPHRRWQGGDRQRRASDLGRRRRCKGAVVVEETGNAVLAERNRAFERLFNIVLAVLLVGSLALTLYATWLSSRIRRLRDDAERAIDARGRVRAPLASSAAGDEIGDLSRSFGSVLARLSDYASYQEKMASRLSHELRTPVAVVRSSLDNLKAAPLPDDARVYMTRAQEGLDAPDAILTRMTEAARLEQSLSDAERERFDLAAVVAGCVDGLSARVSGARTSRSSRRPCEVAVDGAPDLIAQMLDKLVANAVEFASGRRDRRPARARRRGRAN